MQVKELKIKLMGTFQVPPLYQRLFYHEAELSDDTLTMRNAGVCPGDTIEFRIFEEPDDPEFLGKHPPH
eukprot:jgi/Hompol1/4034/HPOL_006904-RA